MSDQTSGAEKTGKGPARGYSWPPFEPGNQVAVGNTAALVHGAYSPRKVGERAELVRQELLTLSPSLADDPESASPLALYCRAVAREELAHEAIEHAAAASSPISPRLLEAASAAARVAKELGDALGIGPRAAAELRQIRASTALTMSVLAREAPLVVEAMVRTLDALGLAERAEEFNQQLAQQLALVAEAENEDQ